MNFRPALALLLTLPLSAQWVRQNSDTDASLRGVKAVDEKTCWASGTGGTVLRTIDGGTHWQVIHVPGAEKLDFRDIEAPTHDAQTAIVMASGPAEQGQARLFKTTDGGAHWREVFSTDRKGVFFDSIAFWDAKRGIGVSDPVNGHFVLFATEDGGDTWHFLTPTRFPEALPGEGGFAASGTTLAVAGKDNVWFGTGGAKVSRVFHSSDAGKTWTAVETPIPAGKASAGIFSVSFSNRSADGKSGVIVGGDYLYPEHIDRNFARTTDGGKTWKFTRSTPYISAVTSDGDVAVGPTGSFVNAQWSGSPKSLNAVSGTPFTKKLYFSGKTDRQSFWAVGASGAVYKTELDIVE
jgi:photosystem II stability/assembly factor-like uncharacterized protein